jgi:phage terminase small subunit
MPRGHRYKSARYRAFAEAYLDIGNHETYLKALPSAIKAGYSVAWARGNSYALVDREGIQAEFKRIRERRARLSTIASPEEVLEALTTQVRVLPNRLVATETGDLLPLHQMTDDQAQAIAGIKVKERIVKNDDGCNVVEVQREYKLIDRQRAAEMIGRHHGIFEKDNKQRAPEPGAQRLVAFPLTEMSIEEWQAKVVVILAAAKQAQAALPEAKPAGQGVVQ